MTVAVGLPHIRDEVREVKASQTRMPEFPDDTKPEEKRDRPCLVTGLWGCEKVGRGVGQPRFLAGLGT